MRTALPKPPFVSLELEFVAKNIDEFDAIFDGVIKVDAAVRTLSENVYEKAESNAEELANAVKSSLSQETANMIRFKWGNFSRNNWQVYGGVFAGKSKKRLGSAGFNIGSGLEGFRLIGWARSYGGLKGLQDLKYACRKVRGVHLASEEPKRYPGWIGNENAVVWLDLSLTSKMSLKDLQAAVAGTARPFFRTAKLSMKNLA
jgi:hypothetical protein